MTLRRGVSLIETVLAVMLMAVLGLGIIRFVRDSSVRASATANRQVALTLAKGQVERIRSVGPLAYNTNIDTFRVTSNGTRVPTGPYKVNVTRTVSCLAGVNSRDNRQSLIAPGACGDTLMPMVTYKVAVQYADRVKTTTATTATLADAASLSVSFGDEPSTKAQDPCSYPLRWNGSVCACPGGGVYNSGANTCDCPVGQAWSGVSCVASTCQPSQTQTRNDCIGGQTGSSVWRQDPNPATCVMGAWYQVSRTCSCPVGSNWNGSSCVTCSGGQTWNGSSCACPGTQTWNGSSCVCPGGQTWNGSSCACSGSATVDSVATCPSGQSGSQTYRKTIDPMTCSYGSYSLLSSSCTCSSPSTVDSTASCPSGQTGTQTYRKTATSCGVYGSYSLLSSTCSCTAAAYQTTTGSCPSGQTGTITYRADSTSCGVYGAPYQVSSTCSCTPTYTQTGTGSSPSGSAYCSGAQKCQGYQNWADTTNSCSGSTTRSYTMGSPVCTTPAYSTTSDVVTGTSSVAGGGPTSYWYQYVDTHTVTSSNGCASTTSTYQSAPYGAYCTGNTNAVQSTVNNGRVWVGTTQRCDQITTTYLNQCTNGTSTAVTYSNCSTVSWSTTSVQYYSSYDSYGYGETDDTLYAKAVDAGTGAVLSYTPYAIFGSGSDGDLTWNVSYSGYNVLNQTACQQAGQTAAWCANPSPPCNAQWDGAGAGPPYDPMSNFCPGGQYQGAHS